MKLLQKKIKAFTLAEMLVVILLTVVVVGLAFAILNLVQKQMNAASTNYSKGTEVNQLRQALWRDVRTYPVIIFESTNQELLFKNEIEAVRYRFLDSLVLRDKDTFDIVLKQKKLYFEGELQASGRVNAISLQTTEETGERKIFVYRENAANFYMNN